MKVMGDWSWAHPKFVTMVLNPPLHAQRGPLFGVRSRWHAPWPTKYAHEVCAPIVGHNHNTNWVITMNILSSNVGISRFVLNISMVSPCFWRTNILPNPTRNAKVELAIAGVHAQSMWISYESFKSETCRWSIIIIFQICIFHTRIYTFTIETIRSHYWD